MFPALLRRWSKSVLSGWNDLAEDFASLRQRFGVDWVVLQQPGVAGMDCLYHNDALLVCRIASPPKTPVSQ
jgi:hypothetical protein